MTKITIVGFSMTNKKSEFYRNYSSFGTAEKGFSECLRNPLVRIISVRRLVDFPKSFDDQVDHSENDE